jgi:hypothetical protein
VEILRHHLGRKYADVSRSPASAFAARSEPAVHYLGQLLDRHVGIPVKSRALAQGMHSRVGAARAVDVYVMAGNVFQHMLYLALHSTDLGLDLPAAEIGSIVFDFYKNVLAHKTIIVCLKRSFFKNDT